MGADGEASVVQACRALARRLGLGAVVPEVIGRHSNLALRLHPTPWVARVATGTAGPRSAAEWPLRELALARALHAGGAPVGPPAPAELAGPHHEGGWRLTLWQALTLAPTAPDPQASGHALARCHQVLADLPASLPGLGTLAPWSPLDETERLLASPTVAAVADPTGRARCQTRLQHLRERLLAHDAPLQWLHGDAHLNNVRAGADGQPLWLDWEDACRAPLAWDLAGLVGAARVLGGAGAAWAEAALAAWRQQGPPLDEALLADCIEARALFVVAWSWQLGPDAPGRRERLAARLAWLAQRT